LYVDTREKKRDIGFNITKHKILERIMLAKFALIKV